MAGVEPTGDGVSVLTESGERLDADYVVARRRCALERPRLARDPARGPPDRERVRDRRHGRGPRRRRFRSSGSSTTSIRPSTAGTSSSSRSPVTGASTSSAGPTTTPTPSAGRRASESWLPRRDRRRLRRPGDLGLDLCLPAGARPRVRRPGRPRPARRRGCAPVRAVRCARPQLGHPRRDRRRARDPRGARRGVDGRRARAAVEHFAASRRAAAERNRAASSAALAHLAPTSQVARLEREQAAALAARHRPSVGPLARRGALRPEARTSRTPTACSTEVGETSRRLSDTMRRLPCQTKSFRYL